MKIFTYFLGLIMAMMAGFKVAGAQGCYVAWFSYVALGLLLQVVTWKD